jgi:hypothetical protein
MERFGQWSTIVTFESESNSLTRSVPTGTSYWTDVKTFFINTTARDPYRLEFDNGLKFDNGMPSRRSIYLTNNRLNEIVPTRTCHGRDKIFTWDNIHHASALTMSNLR